ncbi:YveK family protein [Lysinibacillus sp. SGAir0095]|uniref:YveK family protein n=1 Tax=Lysinibacillus sp. SGAir0095 TaxID=2070463 RepID=UPI0010CCD238|nr:Wzz/FepE/Etk N-terminal domain-containing protein [Lysinibacillus sp. SGAir0095]QCR31988.1 capsular biosynthesis protein [Lysinibacillus sp. SGAir0095]
MNGTLDFKRILKILTRRLFLIISFLFISVAMAIVVSFYVLKPIYQAETQILVNQKNTGEEAYSWSVLETDLQLIDTYNVIIKSPVIVNKVIEKLDLKMTPDQLSGQIYVSNEENSKVLTISVEDLDSTQAAEIANTVANVFKEEIPNLMNVDNITILAVAGENASPVKPNKPLNIAISGVIGLLLGIGLAFLLEFFDNTVKSENDIDEILALPIMGIVSSISDKEYDRSLPSRLTRGN